MKRKKKSGTKAIRIDADSHAQLKVLVADSGQSIKFLLRQLIANEARRQGREAA